MTSDWLSIALIIGGGVLSVLSAVLATFLSGRPHRRDPHGFVVVRRYLVRGRKASHEIASAGGS
jgi:hypothetical protein